MRKAAFSGILALWFASLGFSQNQVIQTVAGGGSPIFPGVPATSTSLGLVSGVAYFGGSVYMTLQTYASVVKLDASGNLTLVAGNGTPGLSGDGGPATSAQLNTPWGIAIDSSGNLYIADTGNNRIRKVSTNGTITTLLGGGAISLAGPVGVTVDGSGNVYIADTNNNVVRKYSNGVTTTVVSTGLSAPTGVAVDGSGNLYISDFGNDVVRKVTNGTVSTIAAVTGPLGLALDSAGNLFIASFSTNIVGEIPVSGAGVVVAGNGMAGYSGDGGTGTGAMLNSPAAVAVDPSGTVYIADYTNSALRKLAGGTISTIAGSTQGFVGDGGAATRAILFNPASTASGPAGELYIVDGSHNRIRKVANGVITTVAGTGFAGYAGDNGPAINAQLNDPYGIAVDSAGNLYISDYQNFVIRKVSGGVITTIAGNATATTCYNGDNIPATTALLCHPAGLALDSAGNLFFADSGNNRVREISTGGTITTVAGTGTAGYNGDGVAATAAQLNNPIDVKLDPSGKLYISDKTNNLIRVVTSGTIGTFAGNAGNRTPGFAGDGGAATSAQLSGPSGIALDAAGNLYIADTGNSVVREVSGGTINTIAGSGAAAFAGDGGPPSGASLFEPSGVSVGPAGQLYIADSGNSVIRSITQACSYAVAPGSLQASGAGGTFALAVTTPASCAWTVSGLPAWASINGAPSKIGPGAVNVVIASNPGAARSATIVVAGTSVAVNQAQVVCTYSITPNAQSFPSTGGSGTVTVTAPSVCAWAVTNTNPWITLGSTSGSGSGSVSFSVAPLNAGQTGTITVAGNTFTVYEQPLSLPGSSIVGWMPHIAAQENWTTTFTLVNKGSAPQTARLAFFGDPSGTLTLPLALPQQSVMGIIAAASLDEPLAGNASLIITTAGPRTPPVQIGSAGLFAAGPVDGFAIFHLIPGAQEAVVPLETRNAASYVLAFDNTNGVVLGVAVANASPQAANNISVVIRNDIGTVIGSGALSLPGFGHTSFVLSDPFAGFPITANKRGTIEFDTPVGGRISVLGIRTTPLTTAQGPTTTLTTVPALANVGTGGGSIAHLASGNGWQTTFVLVNTGSTAAPATLNFFADVSGMPLTLPVSFPQSDTTVSNASSVTRTLAAGATLLIQSAAPLSNPAPTTGSAQLTTTGNVSGFVIFRYNPNGQEAVVPLTPANPSRFLLAFDNTAGTATGVAINSVGASPMSVPVIIRDDAGTQLTTDVLTLAANGHLAFTLGSDKYPVTANIRGTIEFDPANGGQIGVLGIRIPVTHTFTTLPALTNF